VGCRAYVRPSQDIYVHFQKTKFAREEKLFFAGTTSLSGITNILLEIFRLTSDRNDTLNEIATFGMADRVYVLVSVFNACFYG